MTENFFSYNSGDFLSIGQVISNKIDCSGSIRRLVPGPTDDLFSSSSVDMLRTFFGI